MIILEVGALSPAPYDADNIDVLFERQIALTHLCLVNKDWLSVAQPLLHDMPILHSNMEIPKNVTLEELEALPTRAPLLPLVPQQEVSFAHQPS